MGVVDGLAARVPASLGEQSIWGCRSQVSSCDYVDPMQEPLALQKGRAGPELEKF